ncbi:hypothetical protein GsuE55_30410 [Geobacillus subterraneus]|uniref:Uncharacterized protein n=1 Tax=Geobacillus subterraneus TaxID=129338 RepID=A0A679FP12_9BACL|nr:hypothetical protein GsuE55_30410 [Geobacillus subterraneus]
MTRRRFIEGFGGCLPAGAMTAASPLLKQRGDPLHKGEDVIAQLEKGVCRSDGEAPLFFDN